MLLVVKTALLLLATVGSVYGNDSCPGLPLCFCNKDKTSVNCEGKQFKDIPENIPASVEKLYLRHNQITEIRAGAFPSLPRLQRVWFDANLIVNIEPYAFQNLSNLQYLDLRSNKISQVGPNAFSGLPHLKMLYLTTNPVQSFNETAFEGAVSLNYLSLQSSSLTIIPDLGVLPSLVKLVLEGNAIANATFPDSYRNNTKLSYIGLSNNKIKSLDNETFAALVGRDISALYLSRNQLTQTTSGVFSHFKSISSLKLGTNPLGPAALKLAIESLHGKDMVSLDLSDLSSLHGGLLADTFALLRNTPITTLNMRNVYISDLPNDVFSGLNKLLHLDLSSCMLQTTYNQSFQGLEKLTILNLQKNKLTTVPCCLPITLEKLFLENNQIVQIDANIFYPLGRLLELRISNNKVLTLTQDSFNGLTSLEILDLYGNQINTLPRKVFYSQIRLKSLTLAKNNLAIVQNSTDRFSSLSSLVYFNMADNQCFNIDTDFFSQLNSLLYLRLERNNLGHLFEQDFGGKLLRNQKLLRELRLMENHVSSLPPAAFQNLGELVMLNVSSNQLTGWSRELFRSTSKLSVVDLSNNLIASFPMDIVSGLPASMTGLNLTGNPFMCDCNLRDFRDWINKTSISLTNNASYTCNGPKEWKGRPLLSFDRRKINCLFFTKWEIIGAVALGMIVVTFIGAVIYKRRWHIKLCLYKMNRPKGKKTVKAADGGGNYGAIPGPDEVESLDAYISYSEQDVGWIRDYLLPDIDRKDGGGRFSLYYEERDGQTGRSAVGNMFENLGISKYVIVVLSKHYLENPLNKFELEMAFDLQCEGTIQQIIPIYIKDGLPPKKIPKTLTHMMRKNKVLEWSDDANGRELVKRTIKDILTGDQIPAADLDEE